MCDKCASLFDALMDGADVSIGLVMPKDAPTPTVQEGFRHAERVHAALRGLMVETFAPCGHKDCLAKNVIDDVNSEGFKSSKMLTVSRQLSRTFLPDQLVPALMRFPDVLRHQRETAGSPNTVTTVAVACLVGAIIHHPRVGQQNTTELVMSSEPAPKPEPTVLPLPERARRPLNPRMN